MPVYQYKGLTAKGKTITGVAEASGPFELQKKLAQENIYLTELGETKTLSAVPTGAPVLRKEVNLRSLLERVRQSDVAVMTRQLATLLRASVPMSEALQALVAQQENRRFRAMLATVREKVREGSSLADALAEHKEAFSDLYVNMVRVGEASGTLDIVLSRLADFLESSVRLRSKITAAMIYPILMVCVASVIVTIMMLFVIPRVTEMFEEMGGQLPLVTRILIAISHTFANTWFIAFPLLGLGVYYLRRYTRTEKGRLWADSLVLRIPVFGATIRLIAVARFARTLATLLNGGVPVLLALEIAKTIANNVVLANAIEEARLAVREGESIAKPLERSGQFPPMMTHMIAIGEQSGQLEEMLLNVADAYDSGVENKVTTLTAVLEPVMIVGMGLMVTFLVFAILMPMLKMNEVIVGH
jgi:general secretion pathway protein F